MNLDEKLIRHKKVAIKQGRTIIEAENIDDKEIEQEVKKWPKLQGTEKK